MAGYTFQTQVTDPLGVVKVKFEGGRSTEVQVEHGDNLGDAAMLAQCLSDRLPMFAGGGLSVEHYLEFVSFNPNANTLTVRKKR